MTGYDRAMAARYAYRRGDITKAQALEMMRDYVDEFNAKSKELARKYGQRPKLFSFESFMR